MANDLVTAINNYAGTYSKELIAQLLNMLDIAVDLSLINNLRSPRALPKLTVSGGIRPLDTAIENPKNPQRTWSKRVITPHQGMKIWQMIPDELRDTFMSDMMETNAKDIPFAAWVWQQEFAKIRQEINDNIYLSTYHGDAAAWSAGSVYTGGTSYVKFSEVVYKCVTTTLAGESPTTHPAKWLDVDTISICDGPGTVIASAITASDLDNVVATGAISSTNAWAKVNDMYDTLTDSVRNTGGRVLISHDVYKKYLIDEKTEFSNVMVPSDADGDKYVWNSGKRWKLKVCSWMGSSQRIIFEPMVAGKGVIYMGIDKAGDENKLKTVETLHGYKAIAKFVMAFQISDPEILYVNDQA